MSAQRTFMTKRDFCPRTTLTALSKPSPSSQSEKAMSSGTPRRPARGDAPRVSCCAGRRPVCESFDNQRRIRRDGEPREGREEGGGATMTRRASPLHDELPLAVADGDFVVLPCQGEAPASAPGARPDALAVLARDRLLHTA